MFFAVLYEVGATRPWVRWAGLAAALTVGTVVVLWAGITIELHSGPKPPLLTLMASSAGITLLGGSFLLAMLYGVQAALRRRRGDSTAKTGAELMSSVNRGG